MGLFDDAVREFMLAVNAPEMRVTALTMVGLCQLELGKPDEALRHFLLGLNTQGVTSSAAVALRYEIARAYESMGRYPDALKFYEKAVAMDAGFRDVQARVAEVRKLSSKSGAEAGTELDELLEDKPRAAGSSKISYI